MMPIDNLPIQSCIFFLCTPASPAGPAVQASPASPASPGCTADQVYTGTGI